MPGTQELKQGFRNDQRQEDWYWRRFIVIISIMNRAIWKGLLPRLQCLLLLVILLLVTACNSQPGLAPQTPEPGPTHTSAASPIVELAPSPITALPTATPRLPTATPWVEAATLSRPLFLLSDKAIWVIRPGETVVQRLTPPELKVTTFDIWPGDDRLVYGSDTGQVYLARDTSQIVKEPIMLFDAFPDAPYLVRIDSVSWSPDGKRLAITVDYSSPGASQTAGYPSLPSGLWLLEMDTRQAEWVESNRYLAPNQSDINLLRRLVASKWSPDATGLLVHAIYWEWSDILLLEMGEKENQLLDTPGDFWSSAFWTADSQALLLSGRLSSSTSDLLHVSREELEPLQLIDGQASRLYVYDAVELPAGTAFLANCENCPPDQTRLYMGHRLEEDFIWTAVNTHQNCNTSPARHIEWDQEGRLGAMDCGPGELRVIEFRVDDIAELDISAYLNPLANSEILKLVWGSGE
jgi:hypothetical protein